MENDNPNVIINSGFEFAHKDHDSQFSMEKSLKPKRIILNPPAYGNKPLTLPKSLRFYKIAIELLNKGEFKGAVKYFSDAITCDPNFFEAYDDMGVALVKLGKIEDAKANFERSVEINPKNHIGHHNIGSYYAMKGNFNEAKKAYKIALEIEQNFQPSQLALEAIRKMET